jgi:urease gamma subunit
MIKVRLTAKGEPDVLSFTRVFEYGTGDEEIFFSSVAMIEEKLRCGMKVNVNEALVLYCSHVAKSIRRGIQDAAIVEGAAKILSSESVFIGVPESLHEIKLDARIDGSQARIIVLKDPISTTGCLVAS